MNKTARERVKIVFHLNLHKRERNMRDHLCMFFLSFIIVNVSAEIVKVFREEFLLTFLTTIFY